MSRSFILVVITVVLFSFKHQHLTATKADAKTIAKFISDLQFKNKLPSNGAIRKCAPRDIIEGKYYYEVVPYFAHIACRGLLTTKDTDNYKVVKEWINWYLQHYRIKGKSYNYYYNENGDEETTCPLPDSPRYCNYIDAEDSDFALFLIVLQEYFDSTKDRTLFNMVLKSDIERMATYIAGTLMQSDNLCYAKSTWRFKYTMDNSEIYKGFASLAQIESSIYRDQPASIRYDRIASKVRSAVQTVLFNSTNGLYYFCIDNNNRKVSVDPTKWYNENGITAAVWPQLFQVDALNTFRPKQQRLVLNNNFNRAKNNDWTNEQLVKSKSDSFTWASVGYLHTKAGEKVKGRGQAEYLQTVFIPGYPNPPCVISDAGWLLMNMKLNGL